MQAIILFIAIILFFIAAVTITNHIQRKRGNSSYRDMPPPAIDVRSNEEKEQRESLCCGAHEVCEKKNITAAFDENVEYFDDEELDKYSSRDSSSFSESEVQEFREVFYTVLDKEKAMWIRSLKLRDIPLPDQMKDEVLLFVNE